MKIILLTKCGCRRVFSENAVVSPRPKIIYVPLPVDPTVCSEAEALWRPRYVREFEYYSQCGDDLIYKEVRDRVT